MTAPSAESSSEFKIELNLAKDLCRAIHSPLSKRLRCLIEDEDWMAIATLSISHKDYDNVNYFADDYLLASVLKKSPNLPCKTKEKRVLAALDSFRESEVRCLATNNRFAKYTPSNVPKVLNHIQREFRRILGPLTRSRLNAIVEDMGHGPGSSTGTGGTGTVGSDKFDHTIELTSDLIPFYNALIKRSDERKGVRFNTTSRPTGGKFTGFCSVNEHSGPSLKGFHNPFFSVDNGWHDVQANPKIVRGSRFSTTDKNALTERGINIEPTLNVFGQRGIGKNIRRSLKVKANIDIDDQSINQGLARLALVRKGATIDLTQASDSTADGTVWFLATNEWYALLDLFRSKEVEIDGKHHKLEKFSSMGNGFTFELETAIFTAAMRAVVPWYRYDECSVYGDDIICPQDYAQDVIEALNLLGFEVNKEKSFLAGTFFESCGTDYFHTISVRPFFCRGSHYVGFDENPEVALVPYRVRLANRLREYAYMRNQNFAYPGCDAYFRKAWINLVKRAPAKWKTCRVPLKLGDGGIISSCSESMDYLSLPSCRKTRHPNHNDLDWEGFYVNIMHHVPKMVRKASVGLLMNGLHDAGTGEKFACGFQPARNIFLKSVTKRTFVPHWDQNLDWY